MHTDVQKLFVVSLWLVGSATAAATFPDKPTSDYKAVGMIGSDKTGSFKQIGCGVAIAPDWVISVSHVGGNIFVENGKSYAITEKVVYKASESEPADLALYKLAEPVPSFSPIMLAPFEAKSAAAGLKGRTVYLVGYGQTAQPRSDGMGWKLVPDSQGVRRVATNTIDYTEVDRYNIGKPDDPKWKSSDCLVYDLDKPGDPSFSTLGTAITPNEGGVGPKDSGGGWFVKQGSKEFLVAVTATVGHLADSKATSDYGYGAIGTGVHLTPYRQWIEHVAHVRFVQPLIPSR